MVRRAGSDGHGSLCGWSRCSRSTPTTRSPSGEASRSPDAYPSLTATHAQAHLFEREIWEQHGSSPEGHPWLKPVRRSAGDAPADGRVLPRRGRRDSRGRRRARARRRSSSPGHFRFQCAGEEVLHLEIALGYQHRGVEEALHGGPHRATMIQMETVAGDTTIAHATAYATVLEALAGSEAPLRAQWLRALALELERLANHTGDLGALASDVAFLPTSAACGKIRGDFLNLTAMLCGNRFGRGLVRPGGCGLRTRCRTRRDACARALASRSSETEQAAAWLLGCRVRARALRERRHRVTRTGD